jgi:hypothetical protein
MYVQHVWFNSLTPPQQKKKSYIYSTMLKPTTYRSRAEVEDAVIVGLAFELDFFSQQKGVHLKLQPHVCDFCQRRFSLRGNLKAVGSNPLLILGDCCLRAALF